jgi:toxin ParE1/3/4
LKPLRFSREAADDVQEAFDYYESEREGLGIKFVDKVVEAAQQIQRNPEMLQEILPGLRHMRVKKFPHSLWYYCAAEISVVACIHGKKNIASIIRQRQNVLEP